MARKPKPRTHTMSFIAVIVLIIVAIGALLYLKTYSAVNALPRVTTTAIDVGIVVLAGLMIIEIMARALLRYGAAHGVAGGVASVTSFFRLFAYSMLLFIVLYVIGINITAVLVGAGFLGIVFGLAAQATLGNLFAGLVLLSSRPFKPGDRVTMSTWQYGAIPPTYPHDWLIPGFSGVVEKVGLMYTEVIDDDGTYHVVPNGVLNQAVIINYARTESMHMRFRIEVSNSIDFMKFENAMRLELRRARLDRGHEISFKVMDINISSYGIGIFWRVVDLGTEEALKRKVAAAALRVVKRFTK